MNYQEPSREELEKSSEEAKKRLKEKRRKIDFDLPMPLFVRNINGKNPQFYGRAIQSKLIYDSIGKLFPGGKNEADMYFYNPRLRKSESLEDKSSYSSEKGTYRITHIRGFQKFDYFLVCLVDQDDDFKDRYFVLPQSFFTNNPDLKDSSMNGTEEVNKDNKNVEKALTFKKEFAHKYFESFNILKGTSYSDWLEYLDAMTTPSKTLQKVFVNPYVNPMSKFVFNINGVIVKDRTNEETIIKLANYLSGYTVCQCFPKDKVSRIPTRTCRVKMDVGNYYINPKFDIKDVRYFIKMAAKSPYVKIKLM